MEPQNTVLVRNNSTTTDRLENPNNDIAVNTVFDEGNIVGATTTNDKAIDNNGSDNDEVCEWADEGNEEEDEQLSMGLIGKLWSDKSLNSTAFMATIKNVWVIQYGVDINLIGKNLYQFQFYHWREKERVLNGQPWYFDKMALLLTDMDTAQKPSDLQFFDLLMWVRIYNIPFRGRYNENNARILGDKIGEYVEMDKTECLGMEKSLRIRVRLDVRKPVKKYVTLKMRGGETCLCPVKYEKLPLICFYCGKLGHGTNECKEVFGENSPVKQYGTWLKASPWRPMKSEKEDDGVTDSKSCAKKLYFSKKLASKKTLDTPKNCISTVTSLLGKVDLGNTNGGTVEKVQNVLSDSTGGDQIHLVECGDNVNQASDYVEENKVQNDVDPNDASEDDFLGVGKGVSINATNIIISDGNPQNVNIVRRVQKWKKLARERSHHKNTPLQLVPVGEKRSKCVENYDDEYTAEVDDRGNQKKRIVPMEVDPVQPQYSENVASPTS